MYLQLSTRFQQLKKLCGQNMYPKEDINDIKLGRIHRLIDQEAYCSLPDENERGILLGNICMMEKLHEPSRERVIKTLIDQGVRLDYMFSL